eukprot:7852386-Lingulodinium_polyedra.AAC.1
MNELLEETAALKHSPRAMRMELTSERVARHRARGAMQEKLDEQSAVIEQLQFATPAPSLPGCAR